MDDNFQVIYINLPYKINGFTVYNACDDFYTVVLNSRMSHDCWKKTYRHELKHISNDDFIKFKDVGNIEVLAHS